MIKSGKFSCVAAPDTVHMDGLRTLLVVSGLYLPLALASRLISLVYVRRQSWTLADGEWTCEETATLFGSLTHRRVFSIPASCVVYRMAGDGGDPAFLLSGTVWMFLLVLFGVSRIHAGLMAISPETVVSGALWALSGLFLDVACVLVHRHWSRRETWQFGLVDGRSWTLAAPRILDQT